MKIEAAYEERLFGNNVAGAIFALKNHGWSDKQAVEHSTVVGGVLRVPAALTPEEWDEMKRHPHIGHGMLKDISFLSGAAEIIHQHHERFDGKGYPRGLAGDEIPLGSRIFSACDAFDAMTSDRPYRKALAADVAREEILTNSGTQFDPEVVQAFLLVFDELVEMAAAAHEEEEEHTHAA